MQTDLPSANFVPLRDSIHATFSGENQSEDDYHPYLHDIDPDVQLLNDFPSLGTEYYSESSFNSSFSQIFSRKAFSILHANIRSASRNFSDLLAFLSLLDCKFSVIALTETWLNNRNHDLFPMSDYSHESAFG